jgi:hypothetical protein
MGFFRRKKTSTVSLSLLELPDDGFVAVVGESHCQDALRATREVCDGEFEGRPAFTAALVPEPGNPYDENAIAVWGPRGRLGYLSRESALEYRDVFDEIRRRGEDGGACAAHLTGGQGGKSYGVVLRVSYPDDCLTSLLEE